MSDMAKQAHYEALTPQPIDVIKAWGLDFFLGNVVKYIGRCKTKGQELEDLEKAKVYLQWKIDELKGTSATKRYRLRSYEAVRALRPGCYKPGLGTWERLPAEVNSEQEVGEDLYDGFRDYYEEVK